MGKVGTFGQELALNFWRCFAGTSGMAQIGNRDIRSRARSIVAQEILCRLVGATFHAYALQHFLEHPQDDVVVVEQVYDRLKY